MPTTTGYCWRCGKLAPLKWYAAICAVCYDHDNALVLAARKDRLAHPTGNGR